VNSPAKLKFFLNSREGKYFLPNPSFEIDYEHKDLPRFVDINGNGIPELFYRFQKHTPFANDDVTRVLYEFQPLFDYEMPEPVGLTDQEDELDFGFSNLITGSPDERMWGMAVASFADINGDGVPEACSHEDFQAKRLLAKRYAIAQLSCRSSKKYGVLRGNVPIDQTDTRFNHGAFMFVDLDGDRKPELLRPGLDSAPLEELSFVGDGFEKHSLAAIPNHYVVARPRANPTSRYETPDAWESYRPKDWYPFLPLDVNADGLVDFLLPNGPLCQGSCRLNGARVSELHPLTRGGGESDTS
jgi:hypothetical protein